MTERVQLENSALERLKAGEAALGMIVRLARSGEIARIAKATGHDFLFIDGQHAPYNLETIAAICQTALGVGIAPIVRVRSVDDPDIALLLDAGALGLVFPDVNTPEEAMRAVRRAKFPPVGRRSSGGPVAALDYKALPIGDMNRALNSATLVICMIETVEGLRNCEAIAAVGGVDLLHVGCNDLLVDMGNPGAFGSPEIMAALARVIAAAKAHGKFAGFGGDKDPTRQAQLIRDGARFVTVHSDIAYLMAEASRRTQELRGASRRARTAAAAIAPSTRKRGR